MRFEASLYERAMAALRRTPAPVVLPPPPPPPRAVAQPVEIAAELCKRFEGFRSRPYLCPAGIPTIGYGATFYLDGTRVTLKDAAITKEQATELLMAQIERVYLPAVLRLCPALLHADAGKLAAIIDYTFNLGEGRLRTSTLRRVVNDEDWDRAQTELMKWVYAAGKVLRGLVVRRQAECDAIADQT